MDQTGDGDDRTVVEKSRDRSSVYRGRHDDDSQIIASAPCLSGQRDGDVRMNAALVKFVEHDRPERRQKRIGLEAGGEDAFGDDEQSSGGREVPFEANLPTHFAAEGPAALLGDAGGNRARRDPARLKKNDGAVGSKRRRQPRRFARPGRGRHHRRPRPPDIVQDAGEKRVNRQRDNHARSD